MEITRTNHLRYMSKLTPLLVAMYILQVVLYQKFAPPALASDVCIFVGVGLALLIIAYQFYDHHHKIVFKANYLEVRFDLLGMKNEILYSNIDEIELKKRNNFFGHIILHLRDGSLCQLHHIDSPEEAAEFLRKKKFREV